MANYVAGLDLAQTHDWSALIVCEHWLKAEGEEERVRTTEWGGQYRDRVPVWRDCYDVVGCLRWRGTAYPQLVDEICRLVTDSPLHRHVSLTVDATGVGRPVLDLFDVASREGRLDFWTNEITLTAGEHEGVGGRTVPKFAIVQNVEVLMQTGRLKVVPTIPLADVLREELQNFKAKLTLTGRVRLEAEGSGHDDLVMALALATWRPRKTGSPRHLLADGGWYDPEAYAPVGEPIYLPVRG